MDITQNIIICMTTIYSHDIPYSLQKCHQNVNKYFDMKLNLYQPKSSINNNRCKFPVRIKNVRFWDLWLRKDRDETSQWSMRKKLN